MKGKRRDKVHWIQGFGIKKGMSKPEAVICCVHWIADTFYK
jgi:hypothetical protein